MIAMGWALAVLLVLCVIFGLSGVAILALVGLGALLQKYGGPAPAESPAEPPREGGWDDRPPSPPRG